MTNPLIAVAGIFLVGAMYGFNAPGAHAESVTCNINDAENIYPAGNKEPGPRGTVFIDLQKQIASLCTSNGCTGPYIVSITATRTGFELWNEGAGSVFYAKVDGTKYAQMGKASNGVINMASGVCY